MNHELTEIHDPLPESLPDSERTQITVRVSSDPEPTDVPIGTTPIKPVGSRKPFTPPPPPRRLPPTNVPRKPVQASSMRAGVYLLVGLGIFGIALLFSLGAFGLRRVIGDTQNATNLPGNGNPAGVITATIAPTEPAVLVQPSATPGLDIQPWNGTQRFTLLLMGIDKRPGESGTAFRTDTLIILSIDPVTHTGGMLSVPRDLFVSIPPNTVVGTGYGLQRINAAYVIGELVKPGSGPELAMQTVQYNIGMKINAYVVVDFQAVEALVDAVGGVDINVPYTINDPAYPNMNFGYEPLHIPAGLVHMNGDLALKYARTRHQTDDIDRTKRQQQIIDAVRDKAEQVSTLPTLLSQAPDLWSQLSADVHTNLTFDQLLSLILYAKDIPKSSIQQGVIDWHYVTPQVYQGMDILVPNRAAIGPLLTQVFGANYNN